MESRIICNHITDSSIKFYENQFPGWKISTHDCLEIIGDDSFSTTYAIFSGPHTCQNMCRDCEDHFEIYQNSDILIVDKHTLKLSFGEHASILAIKLTIKQA